MLLLWGQRGSWSGGELVEPAPGCGKNRVELVVLTELCSQDIRELSLSGCSLCQVNRWLVLPVR